MKRYKFDWDESTESGQGFIEHPNGEWVKYEDVEKAVDEAWWNDRENEE